MFPLRVGVPRQVISRKVSFVVFLFLVRAFYIHIVKVLLVRIRDPGRDHDLLDQLEVKGRINLDSVDCRGLLPGHIHHNPEILDRQRFNRCSCGSYPRLEW